MPYLRLHLPEAPIEQKRVIALKLIEITMHAFRLRPKDRYQVSVEFISERKASVVDLFGRSRPPDAECTLEVMGRDLTEEKKKAFAEETTAVLSPLLPAKSKMRIARLFGVKPKEPSQIAFQFGELSPAISEPFVVHPSSQAA